MNNIIIVTIKEWNITNYFLLKKRYTSFNFHLITSKNELTLELLNEINPKYIFFLHWSWIIPKNIYAKYECVVFHITDLPYGRGGSPLQNLILAGVEKTKISALRVTQELDAGDIYIKEDLDISEGSARDIFTQASKITIEKMIPKFLNSEIIPKKQRGDIVTFKRRNPSQSNIMDLAHISIDKLYDFIRMLDGEGYPQAYIKIENCKITFNNVKSKDGSLYGSFEVNIDE